MQSVIINKKEIKEENDLLIKEPVTACHMPRACFNSDKEYLEQFPDKKIPEVLYECLIYCYNQEEKNEKFLEQSN
jgi:hypothetical protein